jgi:hypothetical protein
MADLAVWVEEGDYEVPVAFVNALHHLYVLEETEASRLGRASYFRARDADVDGEVVGGIMYARGLVVHQPLSANAALITGSRPFTMGWSSVGGGDTLLGPGVTLTWEGFARLPAPGKPERNGRDAMYQRRVEGRSVVETFTEVDAFFKRIRP